MIFTNCSLDRSLKRLVLPVLVDLVVLSLLIVGMSDSEQAAGQKDCGESAGYAST